jgi:ATP-dependent DNA helicase DinG
MVAAIANSLSDDDADKRLSVIEAGTGTGKTVGYLIAALPIARALKKTVVVSTGTIALQEQLIHKDIPELLEACDWDYSCALVKGRGRYACNLRMEQCLDSIKAKDAAEEKAAIKQHSAKTAETAAPATLGDLIKAQMKGQDK